MMRYHRYDINFVFVKGADLQLADRLSRARLDSSEGNQDARARIMNINALDDIPDKRLDEIRGATSREATLQVVMTLALEGWPEEKRDTPHFGITLF